MPEWANGRSHFWMQRVGADPALYRRLGCHHAEIIPLVYVSVNSVPKRFGSRLDDPDPTGVRDTNRHLVDVCVNLDKLPSTIPHGRVKVGCHAGGPNLLGSPAFD
jgi:hypothetical protein